MTVVMRTTVDIMAMRIAMLKLPVASDHLSWQLRPLIEKPLTVAFNDNFLRTTQLLDFDTSEQLAEFLRANIELALFFGDVYTRHPCSHRIRGSLRSAESAPCRVKRISCDDRCGTDARKFGIIHAWKGTLR